MKTTAIFNYSLKQYAETEREKAFMLTLETLLDSISFAAHCYKREEEKAFNPLTMDIHFATHCSTWQFMEENGITLNYLCEIVRKLYPQHAKTA